MCALNKVKGMNLTMKKIILFLLVVLLMPFNVNAVHEVIDSRCTNNLKTTLRQEANDVVYRLSRNESNGVILYNAYFYNLTNNLHLTDSNGNIYNELKITNLKPGTSFIVYLYASNNNYCSGYKVMSKIINVPYYNPYYGSEMCDGISEYSLCSKDTNVTLSLDEFKQKINEYKSRKVDKEDEIVDEIIQNSGFDFIGFIINYKYYILLVLVPLLVVLILIMINDKNKKRGIL